jgi:glutathione S-transferase
MQLFGYYRSSATYRIRIVLNVKKIDWQYHAVDLTTNEQQAEQFRSINPAGLVPVLDTGDALLAQTAAIAEYLEEQFPKPALLPIDPV